MKTQILLGSLLVAQIALAGTLWLGRGDNTVETRPLLAFPVAGVDRIVIDDNINSTTLQRNDDKWQLADAGNLPANTPKISALLDSLDALATGWPVASTAGGRERFEVAENKFQRRLRLYEDEQLLGEYYFGTAPAFRQTHARRAGEDDVYALAFNNFDLPGDRNDWLDKSLLSVASPERIKGPDFELTHTDGGWQLAEAPLDKDKVDELVTAFTTLRVLRAEDIPSGEPLLFEVSTADGQWRYEFLQADSKYYVRRSDQPQGFTISQSDYERIAGKRRADLSANAPTPVPGTDADSTPLL